MNISIHLLLCKSEFMAAAGEAAAGKSPAGETAAAAVAAAADFFAAQDVDGCFADGYCSGSGYQIADSFFLVCPAPECKPETEKH